MADRAAGAGGRLRALRSVRVRITLGAVLVTAAFMAATGWMLVRSVEESQLRAIRNHTEDLLDLVSRRLAEGTPPGEAVRSYEMSAGFARITYEDGSTITFLPVPDSATGDAPAGAVLREGPSAEPDQGEVLPAPRPDERVQQVAGDGGPISNVALEQSTRTVETGADGELTVTVAAPVDQVGHSLAAVQRALTVGLPLVVGLVALATWRIVGRALRPVELIRVEAAAIGASTLHRRVPEPGSGDEVNRLSQTMNAMLERLEAAVRRQRQFVADASHELRNPVAGIRTDLEAALCEGDQADWPTVARAVLDEEARLETLIRDLLVLAAEDESATPLPTTEVVLDGLAAREAGRRRAVTVAPSTTGEPVVVLGSARQLGRALANLVDNAERYARSQVSIGVGEEDGWASLWVDDDGPGIAPADRDRVFERFTRLDDGRSRDQGGSGLGLAVVRSIATRHHGHAHVADSPLGGTRVTITLPTPTLPGPDLPGPDLGTERGLSPVP
jgi:signal transduction histidine kinase